MPDNRLEQDGLYGRINSLEEEIADLKYTNQKLYKDCVTFAKKLKKIQVSGILDEDVDGLKELNTQYAEEIAALKEQIVALTIENQNMREVSQANELKETLEDIEDELPIVLEPAAGPEEEELFADEIAAPSLETIQNTELANATRTGNTVSFKALKLDEPDEEPEVGPAMRNSNQGRAKRAPAPQQPRTSHRKGSPGRRILRGILATLLTLVLLLALISGIVGLFAHNFPDATIGGLRCYTVQNDAMAPNVKQTDVIVVKKVAMEKLQPSNVILSTYGDRSFGSVEAIETRDGANYIVAADNTGATYDVTADQYLGKAVYRIAGLGKLTKYALTHRINYFAVLASLALILIALLILFPSRKPRR
ncbi:MAG: hypothetical protein II207_01600, partial [Clostridia bacterium]|nr:hypothetical protein [Clostridia bacterium]